MNKNGFTLVEILVSISLIAVVLVTMMSTLVKLKEVYGSISNDTDIMVQGSSLVRTISDDIISRGGMTGAPTCSTPSCSTTSCTLCTFNLRDGSKRNLTLYVQTITTGTGPKYETNRSTIEYMDTTDDEQNNWNRLAIKTITNSTIKTVSGDFVQSSRYYFSEISSDEKTYGDHHIYKITVKAENKDANEDADRKYDLIIYSSKTD